MEKQAGTLAGQGFSPFLTVKLRKNDRIVYLTPAAWYLGEGGVTAMDIMMRDIEKPLGIEAPAVPKP